MNPIELLERIRLETEIERLHKLLYDAHADLGADCGITEMDCECDDCVAWRAAHAGE